MTEHPGTHEATSTEARVPTRSRELLAGLAALLPMVALVLWMRSAAASPPTLAIMLLGPLLAGGALIAWLLFLQRRVCQDRLESLGFKRGRLVHDVAVGVGLGVAFLGLHVTLGPALRGLFPRTPPSDEILELIHGLSESPWLLALWLGPVVWIGIALFEELWRVFMLRRAWNLLGGRTGRWAGIVVVSVLVGLAHLYQGPAGGIEIGVMSVLMGWFFLATGRIRPLVVAHGIYDSVQIVMAVVAIRGMAGG